MELESEPESNVVIKSEVCAELQNIKYKTMLLKGTPQKELKISGSLDNLEKFLENEKNTNNDTLNEQPWNKLDKTAKLKKCAVFVEAYVSEHELNTEERLILTTFLKDCLDRKKLQRVKDVDYDKMTGQIKNIPSLLYNKSSKHFTLKNTDKRVSTLKSLPPKKMKAISIKCKDDDENDDVES